MTQIAWVKWCDFASYVQKALKTILTYIASVSMFQSTENGMRATGM